MEQGRREADSCTAGQEIPPLLWNVKVYMSPPLDPIQITVTHKCYNITVHTFHNLLKSTEISTAVRVVTVHEGLLINLYLTPFKFLGYTRTYGLNWHLINSKCRVMHNTLYLMHF
jgi:hypothetical protein